MSAYRIPQELREELSKVFAGSCSAEDPIFPHGVAQSTPMNGAPYLISWSEFETRYASDTKRKARHYTVEQGCKFLLHQGIIPEFLIVGGSHLDLANEDPGDLDLVIFYRRERDEGDIGPTINQILAQFCAEHVDARCIPADGSPILTAKITSFFTLLYAQGKPGRRRNPIVFVEAP